jgi:hypothetical protein
MDDKNIDIEKALKYYTSIKKSQAKYCQSENGKLKRQIATKNYYEKMKVEDPTFMKRMSEKASQRYYRRKERLLNAEFPDIKN